MLSYEALLLRRLAAAARAEDNEVLGHKLSHLLTGAKLAQQAACRSRGSPSPGAGAFRISWLTCSSLREHLIATVCIDVARRLATSAGRHSPTRQVGEDLAQKCYAKATRHWLG